MVQVIYKSAPSSLMSTDVVNAVSPNKTRNLWASLTLIATVCQPACYSTQHRRKYWHSDCQPRVRPRPKGHVGHLHQISQYDEHFLFQSTEIAVSAFRSQNPIDTMNSLAITVLSYVNLEPFILTEYSKLQSGQDVLKVKDLTLKYRNISLK